jgi:hypothetical protein
MLTQKKLWIEKNSTRAQKVEEKKNIEFIN